MSGPSILEEIRKYRREIRKIFLSDEEIVKDLKQMISEVFLAGIIELDKAIKSLKNQVAENTQAIQELRKDVNELKQEVAALKNQVAENTQAIQELKDDMNKLKQEVRKNTESVKELSSYLSKFLHILQEASGLKTEEDLRAFLDAAVYDFGLRVKKYKTKSGRDLDIILMDSKLKPIEIKRTAHDRDARKFLKVIEELKEEFPDKEFLKPMIVCNIDKIRDPELRKKLEILEFADIRSIPVSSKRIKEIQEMLQETDLFKERRSVRLSLFLLAPLLSALIR